MMLLEGWREARHCGTCLLLQSAGGRDRRIVSLRPVRVTERTCLKKKGGALNSEAKKQTYMFICGVVCLTHTHIS